MVANQVLHPSWTGQVKSSFGYLFMEKDSESAVLWSWKQSRSLRALGRVLGKGLCMGQLHLRAG